tara:strand:+ start:923 stop:1600 length:678 start_codon:yes stop_codon:yes gene_type:complete
MTPLEKISLHYPHERKAMQWLDSICSGHDWVAVESTLGETKGYDFEHVLFEITLKGESKRMYRISGMVTLGEHGLVEVHPIEVMGSILPSNEPQKHDPWCSLCISTQRGEDDLPLGDRLGSMVLALRNDKALAKSIPLLELFLAHDSEEHQWIFGYFSTGISLDDDENEVYGQIPIELRNLSHHFACIEDDLQGSVYSSEERQSILDDEMRAISQEIRERKQVEE